MHRGAMVYPLWGLWEVLFSFCISPRPPQSLQDHLYAKGYLAGHHFTYPKVYFPHQVLEEESPIKMTASMEMQKHAHDDDSQDAFQPGKTDVDFVESTEAGIPTKYADLVASRLSKSHRDYLMERHGTLELDPIPSLDPADPYNWPSWKVSTLY